jgi:uncharacterized membrane protein YbhN (UPF0104 family)
VELAGVGARDRARRLCAGFLKARIAKERPPGLVLVLRREHLLRLPEVALFALFVAVPLTLFVGRLPIAVAGIGVVEGALVYLLGVFGVPPAEALSLALAGRVIEFAALLPGALFWSSLVWARRS